jgi:hypothetical protein
MASACPMPSALSGIEMATWKALTGAGLALSGHKFKQCKQDDQAIILHSVLDRHQAALCRIIGRECLGNLDQPVGQQKHTGVQS